MNGNIIQEMLLIKDPSVFKLYAEMMAISGYFVAPVFIIALIMEYFGELNFGAVVKKLILISVFMSSFYYVHTKGVELSLDAASATLKRVSPRNLFVKKWYEVKVRTKQEKSMGVIEKFVLPNLNDLLATAFFLMAKVFIWFLKLVYSTVYHLTYVFSGITAILYFLGWTKDALKGTVQSSLWCMILPFVIVAILSFVGNSFDAEALSGEFVASQVDSIIWLFGVTLLLLVTPIITYNLIKGDGAHTAGSKFTTLLSAAGSRGATFIPMSVAMTKNLISGQALKSVSKMPGVQDLRMLRSKSAQNKGGSK